jgi:hypothetical protein
VDKLLPQTTIILFGFCTIFDDTWHLAPSKSAPKVGVNGATLVKIIRIGRLETNVAVTLKRLVEKTQAADDGDGGGGGGEEPEADLPILQVELGPGAQAPLPYLYDVAKGPPLGDVIVLEIHEAAIDLMRIIKQVKRALAQESRGTQIIKPQGLSYLHRLIHESSFLTSNTSECLGVHMLLTIFGQRGHHHEAFVTYYTEYVRVRLALQAPAQPNDLLPLAKAHGVPISPNLLGDILAHQRASLVRALTYIHAHPDRAPLSDDSLAGICVHMFEAN